jgi:hypothetical protein
MRIQGQRNPPERDEAKQIRGPTDSRASFLLTPGARCSQFGNGVDFMEVYLEVAQHASCASGKPMGILARLSDQHPFGDN